MSNFLQAADRLEHWCREQALPLWADRACDPKGGFYEHLFLDGTPDYEHSRRVRVQARLAYVYAHAHALGWYDDDGKAADHAWNYLTTKGLQGGDFIPGDGFKGCAHLLNADGSLMDGMRDTYAQAFVILAGAYRYAAFDDKSALETVKNTIWFLENHLKAENGGYIEGLPPSLPRRQNPHMHLFEAFMAAYEATEDNQYLQKADEVYVLFENSFFKKQNSILLEFFEQNWSPLKDGGPLEPGHMMEWVWLLRKYEALTGTDVSIHTDALFGKALEIGLNENVGVLCDAVKVDGSPVIPTSRSWPQTEYLKACIAQARVGVEGMEDIAANIINIMFDRYLNVPIAGGWADSIDTDGNHISGVMSSSSFYHWLCAAAEASTYAAELRQA